MATRALARDEFHPGYRHGPSSSEMKSPRVLDRILSVTAGTMGEIGSRGFIAASRRREGPAHVKLVVPKRQAAPVMEGNAGIET